MTLDITQFYQTFFDEADELLADMEGHLLALDVTAPDPEQLNAIFRAAHSIKGGAATFGFNVLTETTHVLESVLDLARTGQLRLTTAMVDVFLEAKDVLVEQMQAYRASSEPDGGPGARLAEKLRAISRGEASDATDTFGTSDTSTLASTVQPAAVEAAAPLAPTGGAGDDAAAASSDDAPGAPPAHLIAQLQEIAGHTSMPPAASAAAGAAGKPCLRVRFVGVDDKDCALLTEELGNLGTILAQANDAGVPTVWLDSDCAADDIVAVCCFVIDADQIEITQASAPPAAPAAVAAPPLEAQAVSVAAAAVHAVNAVNAVIAAAEEAASEAASAPAVVAPQVIHASPMDGERARVAAVAPPVGHEAGSIRVGVEKVDQLINLVGELVITQAMLAQTASQFDPVQHTGLFNGLALLERNARDLQEAVMSIRMMPMDYVFSRFPRLVRDLAAKLGKRVELVTFGQATELDKSLIERIVDPMTHLVRNSLDHGIETPERRIAAGKDPLGQLVLSAEHQGGNIVIEVSDDGAGLNRERILAKAQRQGMSVHDAMTDDEVWQLIFLPGFSTAEQVTDVSGRGVGMDVVRRNIQQMGGHVQIQSQAGQGSTIRIVLPLTLAILDGMSVRVGGETFIVPLSAVMESLQPTATDIYTIAGGDTVLRVRGEYLPIVALHEVFGVGQARTDPTQAIAIILQAEGRRFALLVDELVGQHQVVVKNLETNYRKVFGISAATILGDGSVALIVDVPALNRTRQQLHSSSKEIEHV